MMGFAFWWVYTYRTVGFVPSSYGICELYMSLSILNIIKLSKAQWFFHLMGPTMAICKYLPNYGKVYVPRAGFLNYKILNIIVLYPTEN